LRLCRLAFGIELAMGRVRPLASKGLLDPPYASTERGGYNLFERKLDPFFFSARNEIVSGNDARAALLR